MPCPWIRAAVVVLAVALAPSTLAADPRTLGLDDLGVLEGPFWTEVGHVADYAAILHLCRRDIAVEHRFRDAVAGCIDAGSLDRTAAVYRARYTEALAHRDARLCADAGFRERRIPDKIAALIEHLVSQASALCQTYRKTGSYGTR